MAFKLSVRPVGEHVPFEYPGYMSPNENAVAGEAVVYNPETGLLTMCGPTAIPDFILMESLPGSPVAPTVKPACMRVTELQEFEVNVGTGNTPIVPGTKLTLHTDGLSVTCTTVSGVFQVSGSNKDIGTNAAVGDKVTGYFRR
jgi:hypothetical protein